MDLVLKKGQCNGYQADPKLGICSEGDTPQNAAEVSAEEKIRIVFVSL